MGSLCNKVQLIGNVGNQPEILNLETGRKLAKFSIATHAYFKNEHGERQERTNWHNIVAWERNADLIEKYVNKGKEICIEGRLASRSWEDSEGKKQYITEVVCEELLFLGGK